MALRRLSLVLFCALFALACVPDETPPLLTIDQVGPSTLESGSELSIFGSGFPESRPGTLTLAGTVYSPARPPRRVDFELPLTSASGSSIYLPLKPRVLTQFLEGAAHGTFRGTARIQFAAIMRGRPVLSGQKTELVLDFFSRAHAPEKGKEPSQFLSFLGMNLNDDLAVSEILADSRAEQAGLLVGDRLHELDGVRLDSRADFLPQAQGHTSLIVYSRDGFQGFAFAHISRQDFQVLDHGVGARAVATICGLVLALLLTARPPRFVVWLLGSPSTGRKRRARWLAEVPDRLELLAYPSFLLVTLGLTFFLQVRSELVRDAALIFGLSFGLLLMCLSAFLLGGRRALGGGFTLLGALSATLLRAALLTPLVLSVLCRASDVGTLRLLELHAAQGPWPHDFGWFSSPWSFLLGMSALAALIPISGRRAPVEGQVTRPGTALVFARLLEWTGQLVLAGLWVLLFLGADTSEAFWLKGALLSAKMALMVQVLSWVRARAGYVRLSESWGLFGLTNIFAAVVLTSLSLGLTFTGIADSQAELLRVVALSSALATALLLAISTRRSWAHMGRRIDPWI